MARLQCPERGRCGCMQKDETKLKELAQQNRVDVIRYLDWQTLGNTFFALQVKKMVCT